jgi:MFS family permease
MGSKRRRKAAIHRFAAHVLLLAFFALGMTQVRHASITFDEGPHLAVGYTTLRTGDLRLQPIHIHPPLANALAAAPILLQRDLPDPRVIDGWEINSLSAITDAIVWQYPEPARIATAGRVPILLLGMLLCALVTRWASDLGGQSSGLLALAFCALDPNLIAHSALITTDIAAVTLGAATLYALYRAATAPQRSRQSTADWTRMGWVALTGCLLGFAQLVKVSALMLVPVTALVLYLIAWLQDRSPRHWLIRGTSDIVLVLVVAGLVLWAGYGFEIASIEGVPAPLPAATHIRIFQSLREHYDLGHPTFAFGKVSDQGWWWYFPAAFAVKTPLPTLILLGMASLLGLSKLVRKMKGCQRRIEVGEAFRTTPAAARALTWAILVIFPLLYTISSLFSTVNIGYRHLLPILPVVYIIAGQLLPPSQWRAVGNALPQRAFISGLLIWLAIGTLTSSPYPLTFFNALGGGSSGGYQYLVDSNLDWGQNLWDLTYWMDQNDADHVFYAHYSPANPRVYGINASFLPPDPRAGSFAPWRPEPGLYAIGATVLQGAYTLDVNTYAWFRAREPVAKLGNALFLYEVTETPRFGWVVSCLPQFTHSDIAQRLSTEALRIIWPDCDQTTVYPQDLTLGLYVRSSEAPPPSGGTLSFNLKDELGNTMAAVYQIAEGITIAPAYDLTGTYEIDGPLTLIGYSLDYDTLPLEAGASLTLHTIWDVTEIPRRPLSLMAHALGSDGAVLSVGDGLGFPIEQWQPGDRIIQSHHLDLPGAVEGSQQSVTLQTGGYWLDSLERWTINETATSISLTTLPVASP